ncbi:MAG TPA: bifunctional phosphoglucose/phosphomannose isomerase [Candidatus Polarisedimenticolia bacterium]|nr:bifunctional phosphoglucose/phosphomannose isomerase [Candidatus Polarisedimenticolia bacterium]
MKPALQTTAAEPEAVRGWRSREPEIDRAGMRGRIQGLPGHLAQTAGRALAAAQEIPRPTPGAIAILGRGGSAIAGDLVAAATRERRRVPLTVVRGYSLPAWLDGDAWVIASSYSGQTEETLAAYAEARARGLKGVVITTGGRLAEEAVRAGDPVFELPGGFPPRAALGHSFAACEVLAARLTAGLDEGAEAAALLDVAERLDPCAREWLAWDPANPALAVAVEATAALPLVYSGHPLSHATGRRWRTQFNENAKLLAYTAEFPEHSHNEIVGFEPEAPRRCAIFYLETAWDHPRVSRRMALTRRFLADRAVSQREVDPGGGSPLEAMLRLCLLGDCASFLASVITGRDPTPVASIDALKSELSRVR